MLQLVAFKLTLIAISFIFIEIYILQDQKKKTHRIYECKLDFFSYLKICQMISKQFFWWRACLNLPLHFILMNRLTSALKWNSTYLKKQREEKKEKLLQWFMLHLSFFLKCVKLGITSTKLHTKIGVRAKIMHDFHSMDNLRRLMIIRI